MDKNKKNLTEDINHLKWELKNYKDTWLEDTKHGRPRPCVVWPDGSAIGYGFAFFMGGQWQFKKLGFEGIYDFYSLRKEKRNMFLAEGLKIFNKTFPKKPAKLSCEELAKRYGHLLQELENLAKKFKHRKAKKLT